MQRPIIIITVPHAICPPIPVNHECDYAALIFAKLLYSCLLKTGKVIPVIMVPSVSEYRRICDLNRIECREEEYRKKLTSYFKEMQNQIGLVIDVHSFPEDYTDFGLVDVSLLDDNKYIGKGTNFEPYSWSLYVDIKEAGFPVSLLHGSVNDIENEARVDFGLKAILIEFNERFLNSTTDDNSIKSLLNTICNWAVLQTFI